jgi:hypothetical protein
MDQSYLAVKTQTHIHTHTLSGPGGFRHRGVLLRLMIGRRGNSFFMQRIQVFGVLRTISMGRKTQQSYQSIEHDKLGRWSRKSHFPGHGVIMVPKLKQVFIFDLRDPRSYYPRQPWLLHGCFSGSQYSFSHSILRGKIRKVAPNKRAAFHAVVMQHKIIV